MPLSEIYWKPEENDLGDSAGGAPALAIAPSTDPNVLMIANSDFPNGLPVTVTQTTYYRAGGGPWGSWQTTPTLAIQAYCNEVVDGSVCSVGPPGTAVEVTHDYTDTTYLDDCRYPDGTYQWQNVLVTPPVISEVRCPAGYTLNGAICELN
jgi:hypothetical protein